MWSFIDGNDCIYTGLIEDFYIDFRVQFFVNLYASSRTSKFLSWYIHIYIYVLRNGNEVSDFGAVEWLIQLLDTIAILCFRLAFIICMLILFCFIIGLKFTMKVARNLASPNLLPLPRFILFFLSFFLQFWCSKLPT